MNRTERSASIAALFPALEVDGLCVSGEYTPHSEHEGRRGWVQGGFLATVLDFICARVASEFFGVEAVTGNLTLRYSSPVLLNGASYLIFAAPQKAVRPDDWKTRRLLRVAGSLSYAQGGQRGPQSGRKLSPSLVTASGLFVPSPVGGLR